MNETLSTYIARQAATVGRQTHLQTHPVWVPQLSGQAPPCLGVLRGTGADARGGHHACLTIHPDGQTLFTGHPDGLVRRWDLRTGRQTWGGSEAHEERIDSVVLSDNCHHLATGAELSSDQVRIWDAETGECLLRVQADAALVAPVSWCSDNRQLAFGNGHSIRVIDILNGEQLHQYEGHSGNVKDLDWCRDTPYLASASTDYTVRIWDTRTGVCIQSFANHRGGVWSVRWAPNGRLLASGDGAGEVYIWDAQTKQVVAHCAGHQGFVHSLAWAPDSRLLAVTASAQNEVWIWDVHLGQVIARFSGAESGGDGVAWSPDGGYLVSSHKGDVFYIWDARALIAPQPVVAIDPLPTKPMATHLSGLPTALAQLHRLAIHPPLALVGDLLDLLGGASSVGSLASLATEPGILKLSHLHWPAPARIGLVALLLHNLDFPGWEPPVDTTPTQVREALAAALAGETMPAEAPDPPLVALREVAKQIDDRLLALLTLLGPEAVAAEPALPLRLLPKVGSLPALSSAQRRLLGLRVRLGERSGDATGHSASGLGGMVGGIGLGSLDRTWRSLLPSQLALPPELLAYRHLRGELLLRTPQVAEPPRLRPTVLLLDVSPPTFGPVEALTRLAAFVVARSLRQANVPMLLITPGDQGELIHTLEQPADLVELWTARTLTPIDPVRSLRLASAVRTQLRNEGGLEPIILLLSQPWFGADDDVPVISGLRGFFVHYPGYPVRPALAAVCERWHLLAPGQTTGLADILGQLVG